MLSIKIRENKTRKPIGVAVVVKENNHLLYGYSLCSPKDQFNKKMGLAIALARATHPKLQNDEIFVPAVADRAEIVKDYFEILEDMAQRRFDWENLV